MSHATGNAGAPRRTKPRLRGVSHQVAAFLAAPAALALVAAAPPGRGAVAAAIYGASLVTLFAVSALYHRPFWPPRARDLLGRVDHSAIFLLIAGTYTPLSLRLTPGPGIAVLAVVWAGAAAGITLALAWGNPPKPLMAAIYVVLGWVIVPVLPRLHQAIGGGALALLLGGGLAYTVGAGVYAAKRPDPFPAVFGYHEVFHALVIVAAACQFGAVASALGAI
ncbi:MAG TPA: hemolysin III family protein [Anaeromyxobacteraceae bacterium]|nr:hemolysin III family protein [Anaeromyxobacteraceae bacterium]